MSTAGMGIEIVEVDYSNTHHARALVDVLGQYARDPMAGGQALQPEVRTSLVDKLAQLPAALSLLAYDDDVAVGLINAFMGFSTFTAKPLMNVHDVMVVSSHRGRGIASRMLAAAEAIAVSRGCCKLTLEVVEVNRDARSVYRRCGFTDPQSEAELGKTFFLEKKLL